MNSSRSPYVIGVVAFVIVVGLGVFALSRTGGGPPAAAPSQAPTPTPSATIGVPTTAPDPAVVKADEGTTVVQLNVSGDCPTCQVIAIATNAAEGQSQWSASVSQGTANVEVPTPNTLGMYFLLQDPRRIQEDTANTPATLVFLSPKGTKPGTAVTSQTLQAAGAGGYCWAGTTLDTAIMQLSTQVNGNAVGRVWADPALPFLGSAVPLKTTAAQAKSVNCPAS